MGGRARDGESLFCGPVKYKCASIFPYCVFGFKSQWGSGAVRYKWQS